MFYETAIPHSNKLYNKILSYLIDRTEEAIQSINSNKFRKFRATMIELGYHSIITHNSLTEQAENFNDLVDSEANFYNQCAGVEAIYYIDNNLLAMRFNNKSFLNFIVGISETLSKNRLHIKQSKNGYILDNRIYYYPYYLISKYYYKRNDFKESLKVIEKYLLTNDNEIIHATSRFQITTNFLKTFLQKDTNLFTFNVLFLLLKLKLRLLKNENLDFLINLMLEILTATIIENSNENTNSNMLVIERETPNKFLKLILTSELLSYDKASLIVNTIYSEHLVEHPTNINLRAIHSVLSSYLLLREFSHSNRSTSINKVHSIDTSIDLNIFVLSLLYFNLKLFSISTFYCLKLIHNKKYFKLVLPYLAINYNQTNNIIKLQELALSSKFICGKTSHISNFMFGIYYYCKNSVVKAGLYLDKAYRLRKENGLYIETLGHFYSHIKESEKACVCFNKLIKQSEHTFRPLIYLAKEHLENNKFELSQTLIKQYYNCTKLKRNFNGEIILGNIFFKYKQYEKALESFLYCKEELKKNKKMILKMYQSAPIELKEEASFETDKSDKFNVYYNLACCYFKAEDYKLSMKYYTKAANYCLNSVDKFDIDLGLAIASILTNELNDAMVLLNGLLVQMGQRKPLLKESYYFNMNKDNKLESLTDLIDTKQNKESNISISKPLMDVIHELDAPMNLEDYLNWLIKYVMRVQSDKIKEKCENEM